MNMMTSTERVVLRATIRRVNHYREQKFDKYVILEYVDSSIRKVRNHCSDELLRCLFDVRQAVVLDKEIQKEPKRQRANRRCSQKNVRHFPSCPLSKTCQV